MSTALDKHLAVWVGDGWQVESRGEGWAMLIFSERGFLVPHSDTTKAMARVRLTEREDGTVDSKLLNAWTTNNRYGLRYLRTRARAARS